MEWRVSPTPNDWLDVEKVVKKVFAAADWDKLGELYFHEDGAQHWQDRRKLVVELGGQLARRLERFVKPEGTSLWVGAGVAELPVMIAEVLLLQRSAVAANLHEEECDLLNQALAKGAPQVALHYEAGDAREVAGDQAFDHLGCISVFTDPDIWPALSGVAYGRLPPVQLDLEQFAAERENARELARGLYQLLDRDACITTSAEEVSWFLDLAEAEGREIDASDELIETAVVGDPVGFLQLR
jgi:hypothetical protein